MMLIFCVVLELLPVVLATEGDKVNKAVQFVGNAFR